MLNVLRHKGVAKKVLWFTTGVIVLSFGFFGVANRLDHSLNVAGKMYGRAVSIHDFEKAYLDTRQAAIMLYGEQFFKYGSRLDLESQTWDRLILLKESRKRGIKISDQEVVDSIATIPFFQSTGKFDQSKYQSIVEDSRLFDRKIHDFEEGIRSQITIQKLLDQAAGTFTLTEAELKKEYIIKNEKIKLTYALFEPLKASQNLKISDEQIKQYYETNKEQFRKPIMVNVEYASLNFPAKATDEQKLSVKKEILTLSKELKVKSDFKAVALTHKIDVKESGLFSQAQPLLTFAWSPELVEKIFTMKQGEFSSAMETPDGWQVIRIKENKDSQIPFFEQIKDEAKTALLTDKGFSLAKTQADNILKTISDGIKTNKSFKELAEASGAKVDQTPLFGRGEYIANMGLIAEFQEAALKLNIQNRLSTVLTTSQ
ncbi:MAG: SurA N-terminal domain-containing protein [Candidatus Omnitrophota bacterium]